MIEIKKQLSFSAIDIRVDEIGQDYCIQIKGGQKPHIGCVVLATPRASLEDETKTSVTSSVLNRVGHKDEYICRYMAEQVAKEKNKVTLCTGGFHVDHMTKEQIQEVLDAVKDATKSVIRFLKE